MQLYRHVIYVCMMFGVVVSMLIICILQATSYGPIREVIYLLILCPHEKLHGDICYQHLYFTFESSGLLITWLFSLKIPVLQVTNNSHHSINTRCVESNLTLYVV